jgi:thiol-disulfide isomerase/thioredoxin
VVVLVVVLVIVKVTGGSTSSGGSGGLTAPPLTPASPSDVSKILAVGPSVQNAVGTPSSVTAPSIKTGQPALTIDGKPGAVFVGAEFCPYCGAERWALIMTFARFGTFSGLYETTSSPWDTDPSTPTFSFVHTKYTSKYVDFDPVEAVGNDTTGLGTRQNLDTPSKLQQSLWNKYDSPGNSFPFVDIGNVAIIDNPSYDPALLAGLDQSQVASQLSNSKNSATQAIVGTANYMTAAVCNITKQQPAAVCSVTAVKKAAKSLGIS